jgi:hypothetical protein
MNLWVIANTYLMMSSLYSKEIRIFSISTGGKLIEKYKNCLFKNNNL